VFVRSLAPCGAPTPASRSQKKNAMEGPYPQSAQEARIWNYLNGQDEFYPIRKWPGWARHLAIREEKGNKDRFELYRWLVVNGLNPETAKDWARMRDVTPSHVTGVWRIHVDERRKVQDHMDQMERQYLTEDPTFFNHSRLLVLGAGDDGVDRVVYLDVWLKGRR